MRQPETLLEIDNLSVGFGRGKKLYIAVQDINFAIYKGETFGIVGESGSGKTTLGRTIMRLYNPMKGEVRYDGKRITGRLPKSEDKALTRKIQMIFQDPMSSLNERAKVDYIITEGLLGRKDVSKEEALEAAKSAMASVNLPWDFASRYPHEFSGGQRQRIGIARALVMEPEFIVADEPIAALDMSIRAQILNLMSSLQRERGLTYMFISHDLSVMRYFCDRIAALHKGKVVELASAETMFSKPLHPYTAALVNAIPQPDPTIQRSKHHVAYDETLEHDYSKQQPSFREIETGHFVLANDKEAIKYEKIAKGQL
ncbi:MAG: ATP-binding cassette domain-containing protein [Eubacteriaceae bacterium]|nr:ATP-binding cassette domain-containing protein [Eubacteriaceae bacterium]